QPGRPFKFAKSSFRLNLLQSLFVLFEHGLKSVLWRTGKIFAFSFMVFAESKTNLSRQVRKRATQ
ncbi:MAG: hypothetical protein AAB856_01025, partial [Patescibacteria group bacterium]